jgi:DNA-binding NarL/FixJ family response regulator
MSKTPNNPPEKTRGKEPPVCRVGLVEDHTLMREGMKLFVDSLPGFRCIWSASSAQETFAMVEQEAPDVILLDITLPDRNGLEIVKDLRATHPEIKVLILSMHDEELYAQRALKAGARGYIMKNAPYEALKTAILRVAEGGIVVSQAMSERILAAYSSGSKQRSDDGLHSLTDREFEVFQLVAEGKNAGQIAEALRISTKTVDVHKMNIRTKLNIREGGDLTVYAVRWLEAQNRGQIS